jgi:hypothetical protein
MGINKDTIFQYSSNSLLYQVNVFYLKHKYRLRGREIRVDDF